jgi:hypothetical protein
MSDVVAMEKTEDLVNRPTHYTHSKIECIVAIEASMSAVQFKGFLKGQVFKYLWRYEHKGNPLQDIEKAEWYLSRLKKLELPDDYGMGKRK